jgi:DNA invertase Pin-like site-specific DNA recombinase
VTARRVALYARVSTAGQHTDNQLIRLCEVAGRAGCDVVAEHVEVVSGASTKRPAFDQMMADARRRRVDLIAAVDVSRLGRTMKGLVDLVEELGELGCDLYLDREGMDTTTSYGRAMFHMAAIFAALERDILIERTHAGLATARARGSRFGRPPTGDGTVAAIQSMRAQGTGQNAIARELRVGKSVVQRVCNEMEREAANGQH